MRARVKMLAVRTAEGVLKGQRGTLSTRLSPVRRGPVPARRPVKGDPWPSMW
jgi:hypothetical protein